MTLKEIQGVLIEVLKEVQTLSGHTWTDLPLTAKPLFDLPGFDSICSVEATVLVEAKLGGKKLAQCSVFIDKTGSLPLSIRETAEHIQLQLVTMEVK